MFKKSEYNTKCMAYFKNDLIRDPQLWFSPIPKVFDPLHPYLFPCTQSITLRPVYITISGKRIIDGFFKLYMKLIYYDAFTACKYRAKVSFSSFLSLTVKDELCFEDTSLERLL